MRNICWLLAVVTLGTSSFADHQPAPAAPPAKHDPLENLIIASNPLSPKQCGVDIIEVGFQVPGQNPDFHLALFRDNYDLSYGPIHSQIRKVYDYNMPADGDAPEDAEEPNSIINLASHKQQILAKVVWDLAQFAASSIPFFNSAYYVTDEIIDGYVRRNQYHRRQVTQLLNAILTKRPQALQNIISPEELKAIIGVGEEYTLGGLLVNSAVAELVWEYNQNSRHSSQAQNYSRVLSVMNREGLTVKRISDDFVVVYYDPAKQYPREFDTLYTDIGKLPKIRAANGGDLVPLGIYGIGQLDQRVLTVDFTRSDRIRNQKIFKYMVDLGVKAGASFVPFPLNLVVNVVNKVFRFTLEKSGKSLLEDILQNEAELAMLLQTGMAQLSSDIVATAQHLNNQQLNVFINSDGHPSTNRRDNSRQINNFLRIRGKELCSEADKAREKEYRSMYLSWWERTSRSLRSLWPFSSDNDLREERRQVISQRFDYVKARQTLKYFGSSYHPQPESEVISALETIAELRDEDDAELISNIIENPRTETLELAAIRAARAHRHPALLKSLIGFLNRNTYDAEILRADQSLTTAFAAIKYLDYPESRYPTRDYDMAYDFIRTQTENPSLEPVKPELVKILNMLEFDRIVYMERQWQGY